MSEREQEEWEREQAQHPGRGRKPGMTDALTTEDVPEESLVSPTGDATRRRYLGAGPDTLDEADTALDDGLDDEDTGETVYTSRPEGGTTR